MNYLNFFAGLLNNLCCPVWWAFAMLTFCLLVYVFWQYIKYNPLRFNTTTIYVFFFCAPPFTTCSATFILYFPPFAGSSGPMSYVSVRVQINTLLIRLITHFDYIYMYMYVWNYIWEGYSQIYIWQCIFIYCTTTIEKE